MPPQAFSIPENDPRDDPHEAVYTTKRGCFPLPCMGSSHRSATGSACWQRIRTVNKCEADERWWVRGWRKLREWSEIVAGPRWKTFIRRLSRNPNCCCCGGGGAAMQDHGKFRYDPLSYALNFDEGQKGQFKDGFPYHRDFSSRLASPRSLRAPAKCSMDLNNDNNAPLVD